MRTETYRAKVLHTCGHEETYINGYKQSEYAFKEGIEKKKFEPCFDCKCSNEAFWNLVKSRLWNLKTSLEKIS